MQRVPNPSMTAPPHTYHESPDSPDSTSPHREVAPRTSDEAAVRYWGAIYAYIRQSGRRDDEAQRLRGCGAQARRAHARARAHACARQRQQRRRHRGQVGRKLGAHGHRKRAQPMNRWCLPSAD